MNRNRSTPKQHSVRRIASTAAVSPKSITPKTPIVRNRQDNDTSFVAVEKLASEETIKNLENKVRELTDTIKRKDYMYEKQYNTLSVKHSELENKYSILQQRYEAQFFKTTTLLQSYHLLLFRLCSSNVPDYGEYAEEVNKVEDIMKTLGNVSTSSEVDEQSDLADNPVISRRHSTPMVRKPHDIPDLASQIRDDRLKKMLQEDE